MAEESSGVAVLPVRSRGVGQGFWALSFEPARVRLRCEPGDAAGLGKKSRTPTRPPTTRQERGDPEPPRCSYWGKCVEARGVYGDISDSSCSWRTASPSSPVRTRIASSSGSTEDLAVADLARAERA